jgi:predicted RNase H-like HicB family nuclease
MKQINDVIITEENGDYTAKEAVTGVASQGVTKAEAVTNLQEAVNLY